MMNLLPGPRRHQDTKAKHEEEKTIFFESLCLRGPGRVSGLFALAVRWATNAFAAHQGNQSGPRRPMPPAK